MAVGIAGESSASRTAEAREVLAAAAYLLLATKLSCPGAASLMPATPVISVSGEPFSVAEDVRLEVLFQDGLQIPVFVPF